MGIIKINNRLKTTTITPLHKQQQQDVPSGTFNHKSIDYYLAKSNALLHRHRPTRPPFSMPYADAKLIVWHLLFNRLQQQDRLLEVDQYNKTIIIDLIKYFINDPTLRSDWSPGKGLLCVGGVGLGKTLLMTTMRDFCKVIGHPYHQFKLKTCVAVYDSECFRDNPIKALRPYYKGNWCFDDLGDEPTTFKHYGNDIPFMTKIITARYERFTNGHGITHATTNLMPKGIKAKYGERFFDRCKALFNVVVFEGKSRRR